MNFDVNELVKILVMAVLIPAIPIVAKYLTSALSAWAKDKAVNVENTIIAGYLTDITEVITDAVTATTQTYVDSLKAQGAFDEAAQKEAFTKTKEVVVSLLAQDAIEFITNMYGDIDLWLKTKIEAEVKKQKKV